MVRPKVTYAGLRVSDQYLSVHFSCEVGLSVRFLEVKVPIAEVGQPEVNDAVQRELNRQMQATFFAGEAPAPLF